VAELRLLEDPTPPRVDNETISAARIAKTRWWMTVRVHEVQADLAFRHYVGVAFGRADSCDRGVAPRRKHHWQYRNRAITVSDGNEQAAIARLRKNGTARGPA